MKTVLTAGDMILPGHIIATDSSGMAIPARIDQSLKARTIRFLGKVLHSDRMKRHGTPKNIVGIALWSARKGQSVRIQIAP